MSLHQDTLLHNNFIQTTNKKKRTAYYRVYGLGYYVLWVYSHTVNLKNEKINVRVYIVYTVYRKTSRAYLGINAFFINLCYISKFMTFYEDTPC